MIGHINITIALIIAGFFLIGVGFQNRQSSWGIGVLGVGVAICLTTIAYRIYIAIQI